MSTVNWTKAVGVALVLSWMTAQAGDWPQWGGPDLGRNTVSSETNLPESFTITGDTLTNVLWMAPVGTFIYGNPTVAGGRVYVGTDDFQLQNDPRFHRSHGGVVHCLDEATGKLLWRLVAPSRPKNRLPEGAHFGEQKIGICSSVAVAGQRAFVMTGAAEILCLDVNGQADGNAGPFKDEARYMAGASQPPIKLGPQDADIIWKFDLVDQLGICPHDVTSCSPLVDGRFLYSETCNGVDRDHKKCLRPDAPSFIALDTETGRLLATDVEGLGHTMWHCLWSPPTLGVVNGKKLVFFGGGDGVCYAYEALTAVPEQPVHFKKVWQYDCVPPNYRQPEGKPFNYYIGDKRKKYTTNKDDGTFLGPSEIISTPVFHEGRVYVTIGQDPMHGRGRGLLHCIDASQTGDITKTGCVWTYDKIERSISSVAVADGLVYAVDLAGHVHCLDAKTGQLYWMVETHGETWASPLVADGKLYIKNNKRLSVFATGKEPKLLAEIAIGSPGSPIAANGTLFVTSAHNLYAVQKGATWQVPKESHEPAPKK